MLEVLKGMDTQTYECLQEELQRQDHSLTLIASENFVSQAILEVNASVLTNKYAEGYPHKRYYGGCRFADKVEELAIERAKKLFSCQYANVQPHSGSQANMAAFSALLKPGDRILGMDLTHGGHLTHGYKANFSGQLYRSFAYQVDPETQQLDYEQVRSLAKELRPRLLICGASAYPRVIDFAAMASIAREIESFLLADIAHISGLVAAGLHPSPVPFADAVTSTTHKTLRGPRGGLILFHHDAIYKDIPRGSKELSKQLDSAVFPGVQGGPHMHTIAAKAVCFQEALQPQFIAYQKQVLSNAQAMAETLQEQGLTLVTGGTDNHLILINLEGQNVTGQQVEGWLESVQIIVNKNMIPFDKLSPTVTSGIRLGTPALTTRGMKEDQMRSIAQVIAHVIHQKGAEGALYKAKDLVHELCGAFPLSRLGYL